jgi:2-dehydropantoate 2-reductase
MATAKGSPLTASMLRDIENGAPTEADHIIGDLLDRSHRNRLSYLPMAYTHLKAYESRRLTKRR